MNYSEQQSNLWYYRYPFADGEGSITIATTRPETMLGDTAVAVNPKDERMAAYVGRTLRLPLTDSPSSRTIMLRSASARAR